eukprot:6196152-Pleurochrysis_carterae.AAC.2
MADKEPRLCVEKSRHCMKRVPPTRASPAKSGKRSCERLHERRIAPRARAWRYYWRDAWQPGGGAG